ncbi:hypothetical protein P0D71_00445 [Paraburkholderia sp. RL17-383-BIF-A]|uniref:hypothetical protein n=1 Tax=Paraburkholderia sp. RL17-383-BIF-A TaxID=3031631 RepID=UPI0038BAC9B3
MSGNTFLTAGVDVSTDRIEIEVEGWNSLDGTTVLHEGGPWHGDDSFAAFERHKVCQIGEALGVEPIHQGRKTCLSCGAIQTSTGDLPCGH